MVGPVIKFTMDPGMEMSRPLLNWTMRVVWLACDVACLNLSFRANQSSALHLDLCEESFCSDKATVPRSAGERHRQQCVGGRYKDRGLGLRAAGRLFKANSVHCWAAED